MTQYIITWKDTVSPCRFCKTMGIEVTYNTTHLTNFDWLDAVFVKAVCTKCGKNAVTNDGS